LHSPEGRAALCEQADQDHALRDLPALLAATQRPLEAQAVLVHSTPEHWAGLFEAGRRKVGCTTWELDRLPAHWPALLRQADAVCVPSRQNMAVFGAELPGLPLHCVPHIRRHAWNPILPSALAAFATRCRSHPGTSCSIRSTPGTRARTCRFCCAPSARPSGRRTRSAWCSRPRRWAMATRPSTLARTAPSWRANC
jgi:hypothetical protein